MPREILLDLLYDLEGVQQDPRYHPEGDALFHSLQVFEQALIEHHDPRLWAAALLHDVGKASAGKDHDRVGAQLLEGIMPPDVVWLVAHHLDLLRHPARTRRRLRGTQRLAELELLRRWDLAGRDPFAAVRSVREAVATIAPLTLQTSAHYGAVS